MKVQYSCISHVGKRRGGNEDNFFCDGHIRAIDDESKAVDYDGLVDTETTVPLAVFDGLGGEEKGEVASYIAAANFSTTDFRESSHEELSAYCVAANKAVCAYAAEHEVHFMGTTTAIVLLRGNTWTGCNLGDSRIYQYAAGELTRISKDHSGAAVYGKKPPLTQCLGIPEDQMILEPHFASGKFSPGERFLLCSDGVTDMLEEKEIAAILHAEDLSEAATRLVAIALERGGIDNITVILAEAAKES